MPNDTVPAAAPGLPDTYPSNLGEILLAMETRISNLVRWAHAIQDLGTVEGEVSADGLFAIGNAMCEDAEAAMADWGRCHELNRSQREGGR